MLIRFIRAARMQRKYLPVLVGVLLAICLISVILAEITASRLTAQRTDAIIKNADYLTARLADALTIEIDQNLGYLRGVPVMLSRLPFAQRPLAHLPRYPNGNRDPLPLQRRATLLAEPSLLELNQTLDSSTQDLGVSLILVLNKAGICVASSNYLWPAAVVGTDLSDREYFYEALSGQPSSEFVVGRRTGDAGMIFSAPIVDFGVVTGVMAVKIDISEMNNWIGDGISFVTDRNGVIIMAHDQELLYKTVTNAEVLSMSAKEQYRLYRRNHFEPLKLTPATLPGVNHVERFEHLSDPVVVNSRTTHYSKLTVYAITPVSEIAHVITERQHYFWLAFFSYMGFALALAAVTAYFIAHGRYVRDTIALNVSMRQANLDLEYEVQHDPLTGVLNRGYFVKVLARQIQTLVAPAQFSVAVIDLDFFKRINDGYGHAAGDTALRAFAGTCQSALRATDSLGCIGGEEFAIILPNLDERSAASVLERMRQQVADTPITFLHHTLHLTVSAGVACYRSGDTVDGILYRADNALYRAKSGGRNQVVQYQDIVPPDGALLSAR